MGPPRGPNTATRSATMFRDAKYSLLMMAAAFIWGSAFVAQKMGMDAIGPCTFAFARSVIGCIAILPVIMTIGRAGMVRQLATRQGRRDLAVGAVVCGTFLAIPVLFQQIGMKYTTAGKAAFITAQYIVIVPILGLFVGKRTSWLLWLGVACAVLGMYLLCIKRGETMCRGDLWECACAFTFAFHIMAIDRFAKSIDNILLNFAQFVVCAAWAAIPMLLFEEPRWTGVAKCAMPLLYVGVLSSGVAYTLQVVTQKHLKPAVAAIVMSTESVFGALCGWAVLGERLSARELAGCALVFVATLLAQVRGKGGD